MTWIPDLCDPPQPITPRERSSSSSVSPTMAVTLLFTGLYLIGFTAYIST
jgi:hypothetical protein